MADGTPWTGIGAEMRRREDQRLLSGQGRYSDDLSLPGQVYAIMLRSPYAHAAIERIDTAAARAAPGVLISQSCPMARHCIPQKQTHQIAITTLRSAAPASGGLGPERCCRVPSLAIDASSASTSSMNTSTSANASHEPGDVLAGRTAVPIVCGLSAVDDDCAMACHPPGRHFQSNPRLQSYQHRLARDHYKQTLSPGLQLIGSAHRSYPLTGILSPIRLG
jgi:hypothetical protein